MTEWTTSCKEKYCHIIKASSNHGKMPFAKIGGKKLKKYKSGTKLTGEAANTEDIQYNIENYGALVPIANDLQEDEAVNIVQEVIKPDFAEAGVNTENDEIMQIVEGSAVDKSTGQTDLLKAKKTELTSKIKLQTDAIKLQQTNLTAQKQKLTELIEKEDKAKQKVAELTKAHEDSVKATGKDSEESRKLNAQLEEAKEAHAKATNAVKKQEDAIAKNTVKLNESKAAFTEQNTALKNTEEELTNAEKKWTVFGQEIKTAGSNMDEAGNKTISLGDVIKANLISSAIINGVKELANGIKELAKGAMSVGMDFESGMSQVAATMGMTTQEIAGGSEAYTKLENAAKEAGNTTQFSATQAAEALNYMW